MALLHKLFKKLQARGIDGRFLDALHAEYHEVPLCWASPSLETPSSRRRNSRYITSAASHNFLLLHVYICWRRVCGRSSPCEVADLTRG
jgi:hypothetical protein